MGYIDIPQAITDADTLLKDQEDINKRVKNVRDTLRKAVENGETSDEQTDWVEATFPTTERKSAAERVADLKEQLQAAEDRAAKKGKAATK